MYIVIFAFLAAPFVGMAIRPTLIKQLDQPIATATTTKPPTHPQSIFADRDQSSDMRARPDPGPSSFDRTKWQALIRFDDEISAAAAVVRRLGGRWEDELARTYLQLNDKSYLELIVKKLLDDAGAKDR